MVAVEAGKVETDRNLRNVLSARRSEEDMSVPRCDAPHPRGRQHHAMEPVTPQESAEGARLFPKQACLFPEQ